MRIETNGIPNAIRIFHAFCNTSNIHFTRAHHTRCCTVFRIEHDERERERERDGEIEAQFVRLCMEEKSSIEKPLLKAYSSTHTHNKMETHARQPLEDYNKFWFSEYHEKNKRRSIKRTFERK